MQAEKIKASDIVVGQELPWPMYDNEGRLLLKKGTVIDSERQLTGLIDRGLYRKAAEASAAAANSANGAYCDVQFEDTTSPFMVLTNLIKTIPTLFQSITNKEKNMEQRILSFCSQLQDLCENHADAIIGAVHLQRTESYPCYHPVHVGLLTDLVGKRLGYDKEQRLIAIAAGLTANVSMYDLQELLFKQEAPLTNEQQQQITNHPQKSVQMLVESGIYNGKWLEIIIQHHERIDGNGYPMGLKADKICDEAQLVNIADRYSAMVSGREYREARPSREALQQFFKDKCHHCDEKMTLLFIKELGIWPPGTVVLLENDEVAIVTNRNDESMWPGVCSIGRKDGSIFANPLPRDSSREEYRIKDIFKLKKGVALNLFSVWGYGKPSV